jgi:hypothetical protein
MDSVTTAKIEKAKREQARYTRFKTERVQREREKMAKTIKQATRDKLLKVKVSPMFSAILDVILDVEPRRTNPAMWGITVTSDGILMGADEGDIGYNRILGSSDDLYRNCQGVADVAKLTRNERAYLLSEVSHLGFHDEYNS